MKVSVCVITYDQERFIAQAIRSVLMQKTNFDYELVVGEDCSQDKTRQIVDFIAKEHPGKIRVLSADKNLGPANNFVRAYRACKGDYVATLDGDDYWISPHKLQKQVDFLEGHPECSACFHSVKETWEENNGPDRVLYPRSKKRTYTLKDYAAGIVGINCSMMIRNRLIDEFPDWFYTAPAGDWALQVLHAERGDIGFIYEVMAVYRIQPGGVWYGYRANNEGRYKAAIKMQQLLISHLGPDYKPLFRRHLCKRYYDLAHSLCDRGDFREARHYAQESLRECSYDVRVSPFEPLKIYMHIYARPMYKLLRAPVRKLLEWCA